MQSSILYLLVLSFVPFISTNKECVIFNFEDGSNQFNNNFGTCDGRFGKWEVEKYRDIDIESPHKQSAHFLTTKDANLVSCTTTSIFTMEPYGTIELLLYIGSASDRVMVTIVEIQPNGNLDVVSKHTFMLSTYNIKRGWNKVTLKVQRHKYFEGFVSFEGITSQESNLMIDYIRYTARSFKGDCIIYNDNTINETTTEEQVTATTEIITTEDLCGTEIPKPNEECVIFDFEENLEAILNNDSYTSYTAICYGLNPWKFEKYSSVQVVSPNPGSNSFMTTLNDNEYSCMSTVPFTMKQNGVLEVSVFFDPASETDIFEVFVSEKLNGFDLYHGIAQLTSKSAKFVRGWNSLRINLTNLADFNGYVTFAALASPKTVLMVDAFRYIPPGLVEHDCTFYSQ